MFSKVLIANRGEIAVRVIRACREQGVATVAVYSDADRESLHVLMADEAVRIGPPPPAESYLSIDRLVTAARATGADAMHPGYGFLAENAAFAEACGAAGLAFIGPPPPAIRAMGDKLAARRVAKQAQVPVVPGTEEAITDDAEAVRTAEAVGYPVMVKAAMGGGGKGMRLVRAPGELAAALRAARSEAGTAFGDTSVYLERYVDEPRHVEVQVLADGYGNVVHLGERECSIQRRHQKLVEESPSVLVTPELRRAHGRGRVPARRRPWATSTRARSSSCWTRTGSFYFLEMNTRLQVEHPVTELVVGRDLVREQLRIAAGDKLGYGQDDVVQRGWAIECRINAEDPFAGFIPAPGRIAALRTPGGPWVRDDSGVYAGYTVPRFYDTLLAKLIVWAPDRDAAIARMDRALGEYHVAGVRTTIPLLQRVMRDPDFQAGRLSTHYLDRLMHGAGFAEAGRRRRVAIIAAALAAHDQAGRRAPVPDGAGLSPWARSGRPGSR